MSRLFHCEEQLRKQAEQLTKLKTQVDILRDCMSELSLRQHSAVTELSHIGSRLPAIVQHPTAQDEHLDTHRQRMDAQDERMRELEGQIVRLSTINSPLPAKDDLAHEAPPHVHGANKLEEHEPPSPQIPEEKETRPSEPPSYVLQARRLDNGAGYKMSRSVWDSCLFVGLSAIGPTVSAMTVV
ncbi:unnamed protein product, partial [Prorocentrum cordatum]